MDSWTEQESFWANNFGNEYIDRNTRRACCKKDG